ncbi:hypothetical protein NPIL_75031, partial [Nephila pilipes]
EKKFRLPLDTFYFYVSKAIIEN